MPGASGRIHYPLHLPSQLRQRTHVLRYCRLFILLCLLFPLQNFQIFSDSSSSVTSSLKPIQIPGQITLQYILSLLLSRSGCLSTRLTPHLPSELTSLLVPPAKSSSHVKRALEREERAVSLLISRHETFKLIVDEASTELLSHHSQSSIPTRNDPILTRC